MSWNRTYKKEIIDGKEVMVLVEEEWVEDPIPPQPTVEELQVKVQELETQINEIKEQIENLNVEF